MIGGSPEWAVANAHPSKMSQSLHVGFQTCFSCVSTSEVDSSDAKGGSGSGIGFAWGISLSGSGVSGFGGLILGTFGFESGKSGFVSISTKPSQSSLSKYETNMHILS